MTELLDSFHQDSMNDYIPDCNGSVLKTECCMGFRMMERKTIFDYLNEYLDDVIVKESDD